MTAKQPPPNIDPDEIARFESLAARWWDPAGEFKPLHRMNPVRTDYINRRSPVAELRYLDVGCGGGLLTEAMGALGAQVTGIDMGTAPLAVARLHAEQSGLQIDYRQNTAEALAKESPATYEVVSCLEMLEHVPDPQSVIHACAQLTTPGGNLYFSTLNRNLKSFLLAIVGAEYIARLLPRGTHQYRKFIRPSELCRCIRQAGLEVRETTGMLYNPLNGTFRLSKRNLDVNYIIHAVKPN
ncbi:MAG: bifunctional 2-polyprenyl-6-hydroxyphenol methylase/3-demethylubiquinol 3-O-methyltransferase UbiG [Cellvibrionales bacterium]|nr:bifunctional 2-polyprenyl-6-hydroxyphenol methylase/3-demethylubiquinol 3-O-methyltransferase UbiG [Cellvibrionales bacterium]